MRVFAERRQQIPFRFRLRTLCLIVTIACLFLGWIGIERRQTRQQRKLAESLTRNENTFIQYGVDRSTASNKKQSISTKLFHIVERIVGRRPTAIRVELGEAGMLSGFSNLRHVEIICRASQIDLTPLSSLDRLEHLGIEGIDLDDISSVSSLKQLRSLDLACTANDFSAISRLENLTSLLLVSTSSKPVVGIDRLESLVGLEQLWIDCYGPCDLSRLARLKGLSSLEIRCSGEGNVSALAELKNLRRLVIQMDAIRNIQSLKCLNRLEYLEFRETNCDPQQIMSLAMSLPNCELLYDGEMPSSVPTVYLDGNGNVVSVDGEVDVASIVQKKTKPNHPDDSQ